MIEPDETGTLTMTQQTMCAAVTKYINASRFTSNVVVSSVLPNEEDGSFEINFYCQPEKKK